MGGGRTGLGDRRVGLSGGGPGLGGGSGDGRTGLGGGLGVEDLAWVVEEVAGGSGLRGRIGGKRRWKR